jgi:HK97 gp10 family phage protein
MTPAIMLEVEHAISNFQIHESEFKVLLNGPIMRHLVRRAIRVEAHAKRIASNASPSTPGEGPGVITGRLRGSITYRPGRDGISPYVDVGSSVYYAPFLELGTSKMAARPFLRPALESARTD